MVIDMWSSELSCMCIALKGNYAIEPGAKLVNEAQSSILFSRKWICLALDASYAIELGAQLVHEQRSSLHFF